VICCARAAQTWPQLGVLAWKTKGQSIALHYRLAREQVARAHALILELLAQPGLSLHSLCRKNGGQRHGSPHAPDKAACRAHALVARCGASSAMFAGDDVNDEPVFVSAPSDWLTVRIGRDQPASRARVLSRQSCRDGACCWNAC
jgi:trehalose 6-phosphate phosphatase